MSRNEARFPNVMRFNEEDQTSPTTLEKSFLIGHEEKMFSPVYDDKKKRSSFEATAASIDAIEPRLKADRPSAG